MRQRITKLNQVHKDIILTACDCDMNFAEVARVLGRPRSSLEHHIDKIEELTGLKPRVFNDLVKLRDIVKGVEL